MYLPVMCSAGHCVYLTNAVEIQNSKFEAFFEVRNIYIIFL